MVKIMADTSTLYTPEQAKAQGFTVVPLSVALNGTTYRDLEEINGKAFCDKVRGDTAHHPISSQPNVADLKAAYEALAPDDVLNITMADGLSGTYGTAVGVKSMLSEPERITVLNSRTLCGPHRYLVDKAVQLAALGQSVKQILAGIRESLDSTRSFLIPQDLGFLQRGGRLMPLAAHIGELLHLIPVMVQTSDGKRINRFSVTRTFSRAMKDVAANLCKQG
ncbi:MAG: DegV family protein, partial [Clostridia bacterium]